MKKKIINILLLLVIFTGLAVVLNYQIRIEEKERIKDIYSKGMHLVSLIALQPISSFDGDQNFFLRTLMEYSTKEGLIYCYIVKRDGTPLVSFLLPQAGNVIEQHLKTSTVSSTGLVSHSYELEGEGGRIYEFSKTLFEGSEVAGTIRIGLILHPLSIFTRERVSLLGMLFFFISAAILLVYFGILQSIKPLTSMFAGHASKSQEGRSKSDLGKFFLGDSIHGMMQDFQLTLGQFKNQLKKIESNNKELTSRVGVVKYEKNQIFNIINTINYGIVILDIQGDILHINDFMLNYIGKARQDVIDKPFEDIFPDPALIKFISQQEKMEHLRSDNHIELSLSQLPERDVFSITCSPLSSETKQLTGKLVTFNNITSQKEAEKNTITFVAHLSHELMTPLTTIQSYSEMLMEGEIDDTETQKEFYNTINKETERLARLIKDLLSLSRIEMGSLTLNKDIVKTDSLFRDCLVSVEGSAKKKRSPLKSMSPTIFLLSWATRSC